MKKLNKIALIFATVYLACWVASSTALMPNIKAYAVSLGHLSVLLFVIYMFVDEKTKKRK
jgi:hypothetical protein